jgi:hypothetical protein
VCMCVCLYVHFTYVSTFVCLYVCMFACAGMYVYVHVCVCVCVCVHVYMHVYEMTCLHTQGVGVDARTHCHVHACANTCMYAQAYMKDIHSTTMLICLFRSWNARLNTLYHVRTYTHNVGEAQLLQFEYTEARVCGLNASICICRKDTCIIIIIIHTCR